jgi:hypothetical protein
MKLLTKILAGRLHLDDAAADKGAVVPAPKPLG